jgi:hypothetical protein
MLIQAKAAKTAAGSRPASSAARPSAIPALAAARIRLDAGPAAAARHSPRGVAYSCRPWAVPPKKPILISSAVAPWRLATTAWASSCVIRLARNPITSTAVAAR